MTTSSPANPPAEWIVADLARSGLTLDDVAHAGITGYEYPSSRYLGLLGYERFAKHPINVCKTYLIPYQVIAGEPNNQMFGRLKIRGVLGGAKYLSPKRGHVKHPSHLYITRRQAEHIASPKRPLLIVEGEKKALAVDCALGGPENRDWCVVGVSGISQWRDCPEWKGLKIRLSGRDLYIIFDADAKDNADVRREQLKMWAWGLDHGASVHLVSWSPSAGKGIDDYLVAGGDLYLLLQAATNRPFLEVFKNREITEIIDALRRVKVKSLTAQAMAIEIRRYWSEHSKSALTREILNIKDPKVEQAKKARRKGKIEPGASDNWPGRAEEFLVENLLDKSGRLQLRRWNGNYYAYRYPGYYVQIADDLAMAERIRFLGLYYPDQATAGGERNLELNLLNKILVDSSVYKSLPCWVTTVTAKDQTPIDQRPDPNSIIPLENGLLHIARDGSSVELLPHSPEFFSENLLSFAYDPKAKAPRFEQFIGEVVDEVYTDLLQEWGGLCMTPITRFQRFVLIYGPGGNGKGVFTNLLTAVVGADNVSSLPIEVLNQAGHHLEGIVGKFLNLAGEIRTRAAIDDGTLKAITGGDTITINPKNRKPYDYKPICKVMFSANKVPTFPDRSNAVWRRIMLIPFTKKITQVDLGLEEQLRETELPGIFNWFLQGLLRLLRNNRFSIPEQMEFDIAQRKRYSDPVLLFLNDYVGTTPGGMPARVPGGEFFKSYLEWCDENGYTKFKHAATGFLEELNRICDGGVARKSQRIDGRIVKCICFEPQALTALQERLAEFAEAEGRDPVTGELTEPEYPDF